MKGLLLRVVAYCRKVTWRAGRRHEVVDNMVWHEDLQGWDNHQDFQGEVASFDSNRMRRCTVGKKKCQKV